MRQLSAALPAAEAPPLALPLAPQLHSITNSQFQLAPYHVRAESCDATGILASEIDSNSEGPETLLFHTISTVWARRELPGYACGRCLHVKPEKDFGRCPSHRSNSCDI